MIQKYQELLNDCIDLQENIILRKMQGKLEKRRQCDGDDSGLSSRYICTE